VWEECSSTVTLGGQDQRRFVRLAFRAVLLSTIGSALVGCPAPRSPVQPDLGLRALEIGRAGAVLSGVAGDGATVFAALTTAIAPTATTAVTIEAISVRNFRADAPAWQVRLDGAGGPMVVTREGVVTALGGTGSVAGTALRGEPGAVVAALDAATGVVRWKLAVDATEWAVVSSVAATPDGVLVGGSFGGTLRVGSHVVSSGGKADGFVARLGAGGGVAWLIRVGGAGADAVQGVAAAGERIAIAGTFAAGADLRGKALNAFDDRSAASDGFVAELTGAGAVRWTDTFGGKGDDAVAGVAMTAGGQIVVAGTVRESAHVGVGELTVNGSADGLVAWWGDGGAPGAAILVGGAEPDGLRAIAASGDRVVVAGFYSGSLRLADRSLTASGGDDAFVAEIDVGGHVTAAWPISGDGREEVTALTSTPGGFVGGIAHTAAAKIGDDTLPSPSDSLSGAAIMARSMR